MSVEREVWILRNKKMTRFIERYLPFSEKKDSILCVGLDPALPRQRSRNTIPRKYVKETDENRARLEFCLDMIDQTGDLCCAYKPNQQYIWGFTKEHHRTLSTAVPGAKLLGESAS